MSKSIALLLGCFALCLIVQAQTDSKSNTLLLLITQDNHAPIDSVQDLSQISKISQKLNGLVINTQSISNLIQELKDVIKSKQITKEKMSSLMIDQEAIQKLQNIPFEEILNVQELKQHIKEKGHDLLIQINELKNRQPRRLVEASQIPVVTQQEVTLSPLFVNMNSVTLTGLLVSLFLVVMLLIGIKCLYDVKTNDQFGRTGLWIGKES